MLYPTTLDEFVGQQDVKRRLRLFLQAAKTRKEACDHVLFWGPPGLGKTTLGVLIANELSTPCVKVSAPHLKRPGDILGILIALKPQSVLFIDEIHRLPAPVEEVLYPALSQLEADVFLGKGLGSRALKVHLPPFTLIGATTKLGFVSRPLRNRFGGIFHIDYYAPAELQQLLWWAAAQFNLDINQSAVEVIASISRGTPRNALRLLRRCRDYCTVHHVQDITGETVRTVMKTLGINAHGLEELDRKFLTTLGQTFGNRPTGIKAIAAALEEDAQTLEEVCEPYLLKIGFLQRTAKGRVVTQRGLAYIKKLLVALLCFVIPAVSNAQVLFNEVLYDVPGTDDNREWIEIVNVSGSTVSIPLGKKGWRLYDGQNHLLQAGDAPALALPPGAFLVIAQDVSRFRSDYPQVQIPVVDSAFQLKNESGVIRLLNEQKQIVDELVYTSAMGGSGNGRSLARHQERGVWTEGNEGGSPGSPNTFAPSAQAGPQQSTPSLRTASAQENESAQSDKRVATSSERNDSAQALQSQALTDKIGRVPQDESPSSINAPDSSQGALEEEKVRGQEENGEGAFVRQLLISEFLPNPKGNDEEDEWVELYNPTLQEISLSAVTLQNDTSKPVSLTGTIAARGFLILPRSVFRFPLRNNGETVMLKDQKGELLFKITYRGKAPEGLSFQRRHDGQWAWAKPTPGESFRPSESRKTQSAEGFSRREGTAQAEASEDALEEEVLQDVSFAQLYPQKQSRHILPLVLWGSTFAVIGGLVSFLVATRFKR